jgi:thioredoxin 1
VSAGTIELTDEGWERDVLGRAEPILVDFWAPWCGPCLRIEPVVAELAERYAGRLAVGRLDIDEHPRAGIRYDVLSIPTLILFRGGEPVARVVGAVKPDRLEAAVLAGLGAEAA